MLPPAAVVERLSRLVYGVRTPDALYTDDIYGEDDVALLGVIRSVVPGAEGCNGDSVPVNPLVLAVVCEAGEENRARGGLVADDAVGVLRAVRVCDSVHK